VGKATKEPFFKEVAAFCNVEVVHADRMLMVVFSHYFLPLLSPITFKKNSQLIERGEVMV
jgi:hypothetical protein